MIEVLDQCDWVIHSGGCWAPGGGIWGKVTKARFKGRVFYVRENLQLAKKSFYMHGGERLGMKQGRMPTGSREVLELACDPACDPAARAELKAAIEALEQTDHGRGRRVRDHRQFTIAWAEEQFEVCARGGPA